MRLFGLDIRRTKAAVGVTDTSALSRGWHRILEPFSGAWQRNVSIDAESVLRYSAVYACVSLIASDIGKLRIKLVREDEDGIVTEIENTAYSPVLRKPNHYQNRIKFLEQWTTSKLTDGNTYVLKERDNRGGERRGNVVHLYVLDPSRCKPLVAPDGSVYYRLSADPLSGLGESVTVPASEIIHDIMVPLFHPLCGVSPITACGIAAIQGLRIQEHSASFFANGSQPGGILTSSLPGSIDTEEQTRIRDAWEKAFSGNNAGRVAVLGNSMKYEAMSVNAVDAQLIEQLKWSAETVCSCFHVPPYMIGIGAPPSSSNVEALTVQYYGQCLQNPIESIELCLDEGLDCPSDIGTELDLDNLMRMDTPTKVKAAADGIGSGGMAPNEARKRFFNLGPVKGGESPYLQQQNYSLAALAKRDALADPFAGNSTLAALPAPPESGDEDETPEDADKQFSEYLRKELAA